MLFTRSQFYSTGQVIVFLQGSETEQVWKSVLQHRIQVFSKSVISDCVQEYLTGLGVNLLHMHIL